MSLKFTLLLVSVFFLFHSTVLKGQSMDEVRKQCAAVSIVNSPALLITPFLVSAPLLNKNPGKELSEKIILHLSTLPCFSTNKTASSFIPGGTQAIVTGNLIDYYTSEGALGKPRISFDIEIRNAVTQAIIFKQQIKEEGKIYLGVGENKPLAAIWLKALDRVAIFLYQNLAAITLLAKAREDQIKVIDTTIYFQKTVKTESVWDMQKRQAEDKREENRKRSLNLSDYYNDTIVYKEYPKPPADKFIQYTVNGKKYFFLENSRSIDNSATFNCYEGYPTARYGVKIQVQPSTVTTFIAIDFFYPFRYPKARRFHFGNDSTYDKRIPSERRDISFTMYFLGGFEKISEWGIQRSAKEKYRIYHLFDKTGKMETNIEGGYIQVLDFETGMYGVVEAIFKFKTKPYKDKDGKEVKAALIEGRFRARGNFSAK